MRDRSKSNGADAFNRQHTAAPSLTLLRCFVSSQAVVKSRGDRYSLSPLPTDSEEKKLEEKRRGYVVKRTLSSLTPQEQKQREEAGIRSIAEAMRRKGG
jgi:hypothetical protein